jgi:hypothetical protein
MTNTVTIDLEYYHILIGHDDVIKEISKNNTYYIERNPWEGHHIIITNDKAIEIMSKRIESLELERNRLKEMTQQTPKKLSFIQWLRS